MSTTFILLYTCFLRMPVLINVNTISAIWPTQSMEKECSDISTVSDLPFKPSSVRGTIEELTKKLNQ